MTDEAKVGLEPTVAPEAPVAPAPVAPTKVEAPKKAKPFASEIEALSAVESSLARAFDAYAQVNAKRADGHASHAAHLNVGELARREIGRAHGGAVTALEALRVFALHHEKANTLHAEATKEKTK